MKHLILIFCAVSAAFGQANRQIINGVSTTINNYPYMASIHTHSHFTCGGAVINFRSILTAAHCILSQARDIIIYVGSTNINGRDGQMFRVANIFIHPDYRGIQDAIISDIALLRTTLPFQFSNRVRPISLGNNLPVNTNERVTFTGWGLTGSRANSELASNLQVVNMTIISNRACSTSHENTMARGWITNEKMCATGIWSQSAGICDGDSGSPLVLRGAVVGVASWTIRPCASYPSVFIRVSHHASWIRENL